jgi:3-methyladenine DNA glycosylase AlkD
MMPSMSQASTIAREIVTSLKQRLRKAGTVERAVKEKAYLKSDLEFYGVTVPAIRKIVRTEIKMHVGFDRPDLIDVVEQLWENEVHELRKAAVEVLELKVDLLESRDLPLLERLIRESLTWALVDNLAACVVGPLHARESIVQEEMNRWATDSNFWIRRSSLLVHLLPLRKGEGDFDCFTRYADTMLEEKEFFIRKAIGWVLRETGRTRPGLVADWLEPRLCRAAGLTVREAVKHLPEELREGLLEKFRSRPSS